MRERQEKKRSSAGQEAASQRINQCGRWGGVDRGEGHRKNRSRAGSL